METELPIDKTIPIEEKKEEGDEEKIDDNVPETMIKSDDSEIEGGKIQDGEIDQLRLCLTGVDQYMDEKAIVKFCKTSFNPPMQIAGVTKKKKKSYAFIAFETVAEKERFEKEGVGMKIKNRKLKIKPVYTGTHALKNEKKIKTIEHNMAQPKKIAQASEEVIKAEMAVSIQEKVCPLWKTEYSTQIELKRKELEQILKGIKKQALKIVNDESVLDTSRPKWLKQESELCCPITKFIETDEACRFYYRNKAEFTIGASYDFKGMARVGFNKGNMAKGVVFVETAEDCPIVSKVSLELARILEEYIQTSGVEAYNKLDHVGFWRNLVVRQSNSTKEVLINVVGASPSISHEALTKVKTDLVTIFTNPETEFAKNGFKVVSLLYQSHAGLADNIPFDTPVDILYGGQDYYHDIILGYKFRVSANAFLQVNPNGTEKLYSLLHDLSKIDDNTIFLDICCGIGTIGICVAEKAKKIIGIEMIQKAIDDATYNAKLNNIVNVEYHASRVESSIGNVIAPYAGKNKFVAVVDPPRAGLHSNVVSALRKCKGLDYLIYVSCNPEMISQNLLDLCLPESKKRRAPPFSIIEAYGVDLFPQTMHYEAVFVLKRLYDT
jgi:tRNA (uracil-5-)-methyltransferase